MRRTTTAIASLIGTLGLTAATWASEGGQAKPELIGFDPSTAVWVVIIFVILLLVLYPTAWKSVLAGLKAREERIRKDIADAQAAHAKAQATLAQYDAQLAAAAEQVRDMIAKATADGERIAATIRQSAASEGDALRQRAAADIEAAKKQAIGEIQGVAAELATSIAAKIIRKNLEPSDHRDLVQASLSELQAQSNRN